MAKNKERREEWVSVSKFIEHYDLSKTLAYELIHARNFPSKKVSERAYRVDLSKTDEFFAQQFN